MEIQRRGGRGPHRLRMMYLETDLDAISEGQYARKVPIYQDEEGAWTFACGVAALTGWPASGLWYYRNKSWKCFSERPDGRLRAKQVPASCHPGVREGSCALVWAFHKEDIERLAGLRVADRKPMDDGQILVMPSANKDTTEGESRQPLEGPDPWMEMFLNFRETLETFRQETKEDLEHFGAKYPSELPKRYTSESANERTSPSPSRLRTVCG